MTTLYVGNLPWTAEDATLKYESTYNPDLSIIAPHNLASRFFRKKLPTKSRTATPLLTLCVAPRSTFLASYGTVQSCDTGDVRNGRKRG